MGNWAERAEAKGRPIGLSTFMLRRTRRLAVLARRPEYVPRSLVVGITAGNEQVIRQAIDVFERGPRYALTRFVLKFDHEPLGTPANGPSQVQVGRSRTAPWQDKGPQRGEFGIEAVDFLFQPGDLGIGHCQPGTARAFFGQAQISFDVKKIVLNSAKGSVE